MTAPAQVDLTARYHAAQVQTVRALLVLLARLWGRLQPASLDDSWPQTRDLMALAISLAQVRSVQTASAFVPAVVRQDGLVPSSGLVLVPERWAGRTMEGQPLGDVLDVALERAKRSLPVPGQREPSETLEGPAASPQEALRRGLSLVELVAATEVQDTGREAVTAQMVMEPAIVGYERYVNLPACGRCLILAGRVYPKSSGFLRHPRCDCAMRPLTEAGVELVKRDGPDQRPRDLFDAMTREQQDRAFTKAVAEQVRQGGDVIRAGNYWRGTPSAPRAPGGTPRPAGQRLTPAQIRERARDDPAEFLRLMQANFVAR